MRTSLYLKLLFAVLPFSLTAQTKPVKVAFLADVHLQDIYATFSDTQYKGPANPANGKPVLLRTMEAQLHSTRIFNENYFAFIAALDDIAKRGIKYVCLPGDYSDDGQPVHLLGLKNILDSYTHKYGIAFFITTGNHDPVGPFAQPAGKDDFLGSNGQPQAIFSEASLYKGKTGSPVIITKDIAKMGYAGITQYLEEFGFYPKKGYKYWATPFSTYTADTYSFARAQQEASLSNRTYEVTPGFIVPDASYVIEPVDGLWLLAIDGNVYLPKNKAGKPSDPKNYNGADIGYNNVISNKKHLVKWVAAIAAEAKKRGKALLAFSHYPMVEFNDGASAQIEAFMGKGKWQLERIPDEAVAQSFADAGITIHFGGHMHINDTGIYKSPKGNTLVNVQTPSLAAYIPAYKLLTIQPGSKLEVETVQIDNVPHFNELFPLYEKEYAYLERIGKKDIWNKAILQTKSYHEFTGFHLKELVRLRFITDDWPAGFAAFLESATSAALFKSASVNPDILKKEGITANDLNWTGADMILDFYRLRSADRLALNDIGKIRVAQYQLIIKNYLANHKDSAANDNLLLFYSIMDKFLNGAPAGHFSADLNSGIVKELN